MFILTTIALFLSAAALSCRYRERIQDTLAVAASGLILVLYILAFFKAMEYVWIISALTIAAGAWYIAKDGRSKDAAHALSDPVIPVLLFTIAAVAVFTSAKIFTWWDDINFWSSDAKQLYYLGGFPGKYGNVSPEFGDYPPVTSIFKWLILKISPGTYRESLQFAGYFALNTIFLFPLHSFFYKLIPAADKVRTRIAEICFFFVLILLPGVFDGFIFYGTPSDITMAIVYGALLLAIWDRKGHDEAFYYGRIAAYASVLMLTKSVGVEWAVFAIVFYLMVAKRDKKILIPVCISGSFYISWLVFCLVRRRVAKLTGAGIKMVTSGYSVPDDAGTRLKYFLEGAISMPMHSDRNLTLDLPVVAAIFIIFVLVILVYCRKLTDRAEFGKLMIFLVITALVTYGVIFFAHISIFRAEDQYLDAYAMAVSIARYGCPFTLGSTMLLIGIIFDRAGKAEIHGTAVIVFAVTVISILITADYTGMYRYLYGYRQTLAQDQAVINDTVGDDGRLILDAVSDVRYRGKRVLVLRDGNVSHRVHDTYISKEASPVALVYDDLFIKDDTFESISDKIETSHAHYVMAEDPDVGAGALFSGFMEEGSEYRAYSVYRVEHTPQGIRLTETGQTDG